MSDIQPTEADREEARRFEGIVGDNWKGEYPQWKEIHEAWAVRIARIRADAVKAEREKISVLEARIAELTKPYKPNYPEPRAYISDGPGLDSYLSDDQEARNGQ